MPGLKKYYPDIAVSGNKVTPDEMDIVFNYHVVNPSISDAYLGTISSATATNFVIINTDVDYYRNVLFTMLGVAGGMGGTVTVYGRDQFGKAINETMGFASAAGGGTVAGTKIFSEIGSATLDGLAGLGGTAVGTAKLGFASGTAAGILNLFGLPYRVRATSDVKAITWINNGTVTTMNGGTIAAYIGLTNHTFQGTAVVAITDRYIVRIKPTYDSSDLPNVS